MFAHLKMNCIIQITAHKITANTKLVAGWTTKINLTSIWTLSNLTECYVKIHNFYRYKWSILTGYYSSIPTSETPHILWCEFDMSSSAAVRTKHTWHKLPDVFCFWWHLPVPMSVTLCPLGNQQCSHLPPQHEHKLDPLLWCIRHLCHHSLSRNTAEKWALIS